jgi:arsenate reductase (glutaredoxin)
MKATIWHNPACGTSRKTLAILEETPGIDVTVIRYLDQPYERADLARLIGDAGLTPRDALRLRGTDAAERGLPDADADAILDAMAANPAYVERPFVRTGKGARLCRPQDKVHDIL